MDSGTWRARMPVWSVLLCLTMRDSLYTKDICRPVSTLEWACDTVFMLPSGYLDYQLPPAPDWLMRVWEHAKKHRVDVAIIQQIEAEIARTRLELHREDQAYWSLHLPT